MCREIAKAPTWSLHARNGARGAEFELGFEAASRERSGTVPRHSNARALSSSSISLYGDYRLATRKASESWIVGVKMPDRPATVLRQRRCFSQE